MAQAGIHAMVGMFVRKWAPERTWLMTGLVLGSLIPDLDNLAVAAATIAKRSPLGLHRTATHSLLFAAAIVMVFILVSIAIRQPRWSYLGWGLGLGVLAHILVDVFLWFAGLRYLWPLPAWINLWEKVTPPEWFMRLMNPLELLFFALFFFSLAALARQRKTDGDYLKTLWVLTAIEAVLFVIFTVLEFTAGKIVGTIFGAVYLLSLFLAIGVTIRMRRTIEAV